MRMYESLEISEATCDSLYTIMKNKYAEKTVQLNYIKRQLSLSIENDSLMFESVENKKAQLQDLENDLDILNTKLSECEGLMATKDIEAKKQAKKIRRRTKALFISIGAVVLETALILFLVR